MAGTGNLIKQVILSDNDSELMKRLKKYTRSCAYLTQAEAKKRIKIYIDCDCNYKRTLDVLGGTEKGLRSAVNYANDALKSKVGADIINMIEQNDSMAEIVLDAAMDSVKHPILSELWYKIPGYKNKGYDLKECQKELALVFLFSDSSLASFRSKCNEEKLSYIKHLLTAPSGIDRRTAAILRKHLSKASKNTRQDVIHCLAEIDGFDLVE